MEKLGARSRVVANVTVPLPSDAFAGLVVCVHDASVQETAH